MAAARFVERLKEQIAWELAATQHYIANAAYFDAETLPRLAAFLYAPVVEDYLVRDHGAPSAPGPTAPLVAGGAL